LISKSEGVQLHDELLAKAKVNHRRIDQAGVGFVVDSTVGFWGQSTPVRAWSVTRTD